MIEDTRQKLRELADSIVSREAAIKELQEKIIEESSDTGNRTIENYISCWRKYYETYFGYVLFQNADNGPVEYGTFTVDHSVQQCFKEEAKAHEAQWQSVSATVNCELYEPSGNKKDLQEVKKLIRKSYHDQMQFGDSILFKKIHETTLKNLKRKI
ncbi:unnamed protein product [Trichobilharzia szidati]|nr:unnamed protein product [Trichobilharzia szidati]